jgi:hypothetical protein
VPQYFIIAMVLHWSQDSSISIATRLLADDSGIGDRFSAGESVFLFSIEFKQALEPIGTVGCFLGGEATGA